MHVLQEELLHALRFLFADLEVVRWVQIDQREGFHRALYVKAVPVNDVDSFTACLLGAASVQFYAVPRNLFVRGDFIELRTIPDARIELTTVFVREYLKYHNPLRLSL